MERKTGISVPLAALYTQKSPAVGEFTCLKKFADFCKLSGLSIIQLLPVNDTGTQSSPYSGLSAFALHPLYINIKALPEFQKAYESDRAFSSACNSFYKEFNWKKRFDYDRILSEKTKLLHLLYNWIEKQFAAETKNKSQINEITVVSNSSFIQQFNAQTEKFIRENSWIVPYAVYKNLKNIAQQASWKEWDENLQKLSHEQILLRWNNKALKSSHTFFVWCQMRAAEQFKEAAGYVKSLGIVLKGDIPIMMNEDSADTWAFPEYFNHYLRSGSPPDGENPFGQSWGFPVYNWERLAADNYDWWKNRIACASQFYDAFRIDHVLGFFRIWCSDENDSTAYLGHTEPYKSISRKELIELSFDDSRLRWLSEPHIPTGLIEGITWNYDEACRMLSLVADRIENEELWLFKKNITADRQIYETCFSTEDSQKDSAVKNALAGKWRDRTLIEITKNHYVFTWSYSETTAWKSLNWDEQQKLLSVKEKIDDAENKLWKKQGTNLLTAISSASQMTACAEDLGAIPDCVPEVLGKLNILGLRVNRWTRLWQKEGQPYVAFEKYPVLSVSTTSVHDSSTLRQWWTNEKESVRAFLKLWDSQESNSLFDNTAPVNADEAFSPEVAFFCLSSIALSASTWFVNPLQDYLFLDEKFYAENPDDERINIPGTVSGFNWTYRMPVSIEELMENKQLTAKIKNIVKSHDSIYLSGV